MEFLPLSWSQPFASVRFHGQSDGTVAERLLYNAKVFTAEPAKPYAEAVAIRGDKIVAVGNRSEAAAALGANPQRVDLQGRTLLPGFVDSHNHAVQGGEALNAANVPETVVSVPELASFVAEARTAGKGMNGEVLKVTGLPLDFWLKVEELEQVFSSGSYESVPVFLFGMGLSHRLGQSRAAGQGGPDERIHRRANRRAAEALWRRT